MDSLNRPTSDQAEEGERFDQSIINNQHMECYVYLNSRQWLEGQDVVDTSRSMIKMLSIVFHYDLLL